MLGHGFPHHDEGRDAAAAAASTGLPDSVSGWAVFLDVDGTLLDLAPTPESVVVPVGLQDDLEKLSRKIDRALALVTGRPINFVDRLFPGHGFCIAGLHGAEWRDSSGKFVGIETGDDFVRAKKSLAKAAEAWPGAIVEDKGVAIAVHYRNAPHLEAEARAFMSRLVEDLGVGWALQTGKFVVEIRPGGRDKGEAVKTFLQNLPFRGRRPLVIGDDVTDETMFTFANAAGGLSVRVGGGELVTSAQASIASPADVRLWIARMTE